ncbi:methyl-accepting chemotaxis protein [Kamptonema sp. UHCC 0994]|uniref:methyl-accepting chemotaxis protein n=1 Tax=Kamptonema sp. UHCC 0994 TaxID=3031329 RepID=UPI0023BA27A1|nr:methyl-accepting chemotaxis protein [Kamptonema sp. UHCC 0994]MDF0553804.1 methyl-accepting chemotaxis protein [Kamptonema sp. UHCC 0994]
MFNQLKIRSRMLIGYATPAVVCLGLVALTYSTVNETFNTFKEVERVQNIIIANNNMSRGAEQMIRNLRGYLIKRDDFFLTDYQTGLQLATTSANSVKPLIKIPEQLIKLNKMVELVNEYSDYANRSISLIKQNKRAEAIALFNQGQATDFVKEFDELSVIFSKNEQYFLNEKMKEAQASLNFLIVSLVSGSVFLLLFDVVIAWFISSGIIKTINQAISAIATSSTEIATTVEEQERMATQQAASVNQTTTTMDELGASSRATAQQIESAASEAKEALNLAGGGTKAVGKTLEAMATLQIKVSEMQGKIIQLREQTDQIGNISTLVSDLANQTNMLALNAAVEAVRAGEHGKGFAVVAAEIRKLADQSKKSADKINLLVVDIQRAINSTVIVTDEGTKTVEAGVNIAEETAQAFVSVANAINNVVLSSQQISMNAKQQVIAIEQVVDAMNSLNQAAAQTASGISQTKVGTQKLNEAALELKAVV